MLAIHHNHESLRLLRECYSCLNLQQQQQKLMLHSRPICSRNSNPPLILPHRSVPPSGQKCLSPAAFAPPGPVNTAALTTTIPVSVAPGANGHLYPDPIICCYLCCCCRSSCPRLSHRPRCHDRLCCCPCLCCLLQQYGRPQRMSRRMKK